MMEFILGYILIGILLNVIGPLSKSITTQMNKLRNQSLMGYLLEKKSIPQWKKILYEIILRVFAVLLYPVLYLIITVDYFRKKSFDKLAKTGEEDDII